VPYERLIRFNKSGPITPLGEGIRITMVHAEHSSDVVHTDPVSKQKSVHPGGEPCGYIIELENGFTIYHAGDTGVFSDMAFIGEYYQPDLVACCPSVVTSPWTRTMRPLPFGTI
jgi:L-ascorbate metabolism protein UlaG (beta-lactamase superfamily)